MNGRKWIITLATILMIIIYKPSFAAPLVNWREIKAVSMRGELGKSGFFFSTGY